MLETATGHEAKVSDKLSPVGEQSAAERALLSTIQTLDRSGTASAGDLVAALTTLAAHYVLRSALNDAAPLLSRALSISERAGDAEQSDIGIHLNDLARICLKQSAYSLAEPLLTRLVAIKQSKGENHPEVATVLASLASVRQGLGQHESAEQLWRRVLDIRELTLAPNHFSVASALEHLAESCAARGKFGEALPLYQRAQTIRQLTLGNNHPSVQTSRDRIADLLLQASEDFAGAIPEASAPVSTPEGFRLKFPADQRVVAPPPFVAPAAQPPRSPDERPAKKTASVEPVQSHVVMPPPRESQASEPADADDASEGGTAPYHGILLSIANELKDQEGEEHALQYQNGGIPAWASAFVGRHKRNVAIAGAAIVAIVVGAWAWDAKTGKQTSGLSAELQPATAFAAAPTAPPVARVTSNDSQPTVLHMTAASTPVRSKVQQVSEAPRRGSDRRETNSVTIPKLSPRAMLNLDSAVTAAGAGTRKLSESIVPDVGTLPALSDRSGFETPEFSATRAHRALLIGSLPVPTLPNYSSGAEGEVVVSFAVDTQGRPVMATFSVVRSPDPMLSSAVRKVIPVLRFDPAQTAGPDPKRVVDTVQVVYRFAQHVKQ